MLRPDGHRYTTAPPDQPTGASIVMKACATSNCAQRRGSNRRDRAVDVVARWVDARDYDADGRWASGAGSVDDCLGEGEVRRRHVISTTMSSYAVTATERNRCVANSQKLRELAIRHAQA